MLILLQKYLYRQNQYEKNMGQQMSGLIAEMVTAFGMNPKVGGFESRSGRDIFCPKKLWHFHKNVHSCVENEYCCRCTVNISNITFT